MKIIFTVWDSAYRFICTGIICVSVHCHEWHSLDWFIISSIYCCFTF